MPLRTAIGANLECAFASASYGDATYRNQFVVRYAPTSRRESVSPVRGTVVRVCAQLEEAKNDAMSRASRGQYAEGIGVG